jgi:VCBS repeat protein
VDLDGDGNRDILSGSYSRQSSDMAGLFQVLWGRADGTFKAAETLNGTDGQPLIIPAPGPPGQSADVIKRICTRPFATDWNGDGKLDLVVGNFMGTFYLFKGEGGGKFAPIAEPMKTGDGAPLQVTGHHGDPFVIDWDGDGELDILSGSAQGGVQWAENDAGAGKLPRLSQFKTLIEAGPEVEFGSILKEADLKGPLGSTRIWVDDYNGDGKLDIFVGDLTNLVSPADNLTEEQFKQKSASWLKSLEEASQKANETKDEKERSAARERVQKLYAERETFAKEDDTGFVWLYLQK